MITYRVVLTCTVPGKINPDNQLPYSCKDVFIARFFPNFQAGVVLKETIDFMQRKIQRQTAEGEEVDPDDLQVCEWLQKLIGESSEEPILAFSSDGSPHFFVDLSGCHIQLHRCSST